MKKDELNRAIGLVDEDLILEAEKMEKAPAARVRWGWLKAAAAAACLALICFGGVKLLGGKAPAGHDGPVWPTRYADRGVSESSTAAGELAYAKKWSEKSITEKYPELLRETVLYIATGASAPEALKGQALGGTELTGGDIYMDAVYTLKGDVYRMEGYPETLALLVRPEGEEGLYVYMNPWYAPANMKEYFEAFALEEKGSVDRLTYSLRAGAGAGTPWRYVEFAGFETEAFWKLIRDNGALIPLSEEEKENVGGSGKSVYSYDWSLGWSVSAPELGIGNKGLHLTDQGILMTNLGDSLWAWQLDPAAAQAFRDMVLEKYEGVEIIFEVPSADVGVPEAAPEGTVAGSTAVPE